MPKLHKNPFPLNMYIRQLDQNRPFAISRWGDGEWLATVGPGQNDKRNANGSRYSSMLKAGLRAVIEARLEAPFYYGLLNIAVSNLGERIEEWMVQNDVAIQWVDGDSLLNASLAGQLYSFTHAVRKRRAVYVGPERLRRSIKRFFPDIAYLTIPPSDAFDQRDNIMLDIGDHVAANRDTFLFSAGMATNYFIYHMWLRSERRLILIDCGSMFDGYAGLNSRSYMQRYDFDRLEVVNTGLRAAEIGEKFHAGE